MYIYLKLFLISFSYFIDLKMIFHVLNRNFLPVSKDFRLLEDRRQKLIDMIQRNPPEKYVFLI